MDAVPDRQPSDKDLDRRARALRKKSQQLAQKLGTDKKFFTQRSSDRKDYIAEPIHNAKLTIPEPKEKIEPDDEVARQKAEDEKRERWLAEE